MSFFNNDGGFTLLETMIAAAVLALGIITYTGMQISSTRGNAQGISITGKANWAADQVEKLMAMPYNDLAAMDADGDGTDQDPLESGIDIDDNGDSVVDVNENFGLHHDTAATADGSVTSPDANATYTVFWNVAVDHPLVNMLTLNVIVTSKKDTAQHAAVQFQYIKSRTI